MDDAFHKLGLSHDFCLFCHFPQDGKCKSEKVKGQLLDKKQTKKHTFKMYCKT
jgi:hypothetical protein